MIVGELGEVVIDVKHDRYRDDECNGVDVCANELLDDVPVDALDVMQRIAFLHPSQFVPGEFPEPFDDGMKQDEQAQPDASDTCSYFFEFSLHR